MEIICPECRIGELRPDHTADHEESMMLDVILKAICKNEDCLAEFDLMYRFEEAV